MKKVPFQFITQICIVLFSTLIVAQDAEPVKYTASKKGKFYISWGGNRESFSKSDITFKGDNYNFTIQDAVADDKPKGWHLDYINPSRMTIPQTNLRIGYFINDHYSISLNVDHMKYVMRQYQVANIDGFINLDSSEAGSEFNGTYTNSPTTLTAGFLQFEHTNGLNYVHLEFSRTDDISSLFKINNTDKFQVNITEGLGTGILYPKTNTYLLKKFRYDEFHLSGYGVSANVGLNLTFFKHFYIQGDLRGGYINMNDIRTTADSSDSASQYFFFLQRIISVGTIFRI